MKAPGSGRCGVAGFIFARGRVEDAMQATGSEILRGRQTAELKQSGRAQWLVYEHSYKRRRQKKDLKRGGGRGAAREEEAGLSATGAGLSDNFGVVATSPEESSTTKAWHDRRRAPELKVTCTFCVSASRTFTQSQLFRSRFTKAS